MGAAAEALTAAAQDKGAASGTRAETAEDGAGGAPAVPVFVDAWSDRQIATPHDHVLVELTKNGAVRISGTSRANGVPAYLAPPLFASLPQAILAAHQWAEENGVGYVFLTDRTAG